MPQTKSKSATSSSTSRSTNTKAKTSGATASKQQQSAGGELEKFFYDSLKDIYWAEKHLRTRHTGFAVAGGGTDLAARSTTSHWQQRIL